MMWSIVEDCILGEYSGKLEGLWRKAEWKSIMEMGRIMEDMEEYEKKRKKEERGDTCPTQYVVVQPIYKILTDCVCLVTIVESGISKVYICECVWNNKCPVSCAHSSVLLPG